MKIKTKQISYEEFEKIQSCKYELPKKQSTFFRMLMNFLSGSELKAVDFQPVILDMKTVKDDTPCLFLMNHSSFTDLQIVARLLKKRPYHIVCTNDGFIGKRALMENLGCIPTRKFITDVMLIKQMKHVLKNLKESVVMYPEASYSFDGTQTPLPDSLGKCIKLLGVPVVMIRTKGAFGRDPLYNNLQKRQVKVTAYMECMLSCEEIAEKTADEINEILKQYFTYDHFKEQFESGVLIKEDFRADGLHRALYKCPSCKTEGKMVGKGVHISCKSCQKEYTLLENGKLMASDHNTEFEFVSDWYAWERECVKKEILDGKYLLDTDVEIRALKDLDCIYEIGDGHLVHNKDGFVLEGCDNKLRYMQTPAASYSLYADYFWYELGDMISIGDTKCQYYCFPKDQEKAVVAKARLAAEEMYKLR